MTAGDVRAALAAAVSTALGACALTPVFSSSSWVAPVLAVVLVVLAGGLLLRLGAPAVWSRLTNGRPVPERVAAAGVAVVPLGQLFLVLCLLTARYAPAAATAGVLPTSRSLAALGEVLTDGTREIQEQATPALALPGLVALTMVLVAVIAVLVDLVAVAGRQAALAGLGLLALYCVPVATVTGGIGLVAIAAPATGLALLLWADQRRRVGAPASPAAGPRLGTGTVAAVRVGGGAILAGLVLGSLVPTFTEGSLTTGLGGSGTGSTGTALDPVAEMRGQLQLPDPIELLRVDASVQKPGYLRGVSLDEYDAVNGWSMSNLAGEVPIDATDTLAAPPPAQSVREVSATIEVLEHDDRFLPILSYPLSVRMDDGDSDNWRFDLLSGTVFGRDVSSGGRTYEVTAEEPRPTADRLGQAEALPADDPIQQHFTLLPELDPSVVDLVRSVVGDTGGPYDRVSRIHAFLTDRANRFRYSLSTEPGTSGDDLADFLRLRRGYCEQYAGAMAVMVRAAGVPSRVVLGYTPGRIQPDGTRLITSDDAHAWVEVYFQDLGWVPFDPTPISGDRAADMPWAERGDESTDADDRLGAPATTAPSQAGPTPREDRAGDAASSASAGGRSAAISWPVVGWTGGVVLALALLAAPALARRVQRRRRTGDGSAGDLWDELTATALDLDIAVEPTWTPRRAGQELATVVNRAGGPADGPAAEAVRRLALAEESASYGRARDERVHPDLVVALRTARRGLMAAAPRSTRLRARLWPTSTVVGAAGRLAGVIGRRFPVRRRPRAA